MFPVHRLYNVLHWLRLYIREHLIEEGIGLVVGVEERSVLVSGKIRQVKEVQRHLFDGRFADNESSNRACQLLSFCNLCQEWLKLLSLLVRNNPVEFPFAYINYAPTFSRKMKKNTTVRVPMAQADLWTVFFQPARRFWLTVIPAGVFSCT